MKFKRFNDIKVWQKSHLFVLEIYKITLGFPNDERFGLISQVRRASVSVCANISEGYLKSVKDFSRFLDISRGSLEEVKYYLILSRDLGFIGSDEYERLFQLADEIGKMLYSLKINLVSRP